MLMTAVAFIRLSLVKGGSWLHRFGNVWLARDRKENRHVALKILSVHASREVDAGRLRELSILRTIAAAAPSHQGFHHVLHFLHEFTFESFYGSDIYRHRCAQLQCLEPTEAAARSTTPSQVYLATCQTRTESTRISTRHMRSCPFWCVELMHQSQLLTKQVRQT
ncbi:hypothetical protein BYT27DRAFT_6403795 [Phlegmacium glaucopus]|nr:hypothetical protein BYT27DRAFT_6403795 [Phlegmacium glaucopus]